MKCILNSISKTNVHLTHLHTNRKTILFTMVWILIYANATTWKLRGHQRCAMQQWVQRLFVLKDSAFEIATTTCSTMMRSHGGFKLAVDRLVSRYWLLLIAMSFP